MLVVFFSWVGIANASLEITEIMYDPEGTDANREWIEIKNTGISSVDLTEKVGKYTRWRFFKGPDNNYQLFSFDGSKEILPGGYAIIASDPSYFKIDWPNFGDVIFDSTNFSLTGSSTDIGIKDTSDDSSFSPINYIPDPNANNNGNSLQLRGSVWKAAIPTPGIANSSNTNSSDNSSEDNTVDETIDSIPVVNNTSEIFKITTKIISPKIVTAGIPFSLSSLTTTNRGETYAVGKFVWNFGDGMIREVMQSNPFEYVYEYPGEYVLTLSYYDSIFSIKPDAIDKMTIKIIPSGINISSVGTTSDPFIEIENKSTYEIILSNWVVTAGTHYFIIPEGTTLLPNKKIKLSPKITGFVGEDIKSVIIANPNKEIIATYPTEIKKPIQKISSVNKTTNSNLIPADNSQDDVLLKDSQIINLNDLGANAKETGINIPNSTYPIIGLLVVIGLGIASFLLIKKRRDIEDYVEKGIRAEDMTIIE